MEVLYHVWFSIKGRKPVLDGEIGEDAKRLLTETAERTGTFRKRLSASGGKNLAPRDKGQTLRFPAAASHAHCIKKLRVSTRRLVLAKTVTVE